MRLLAVLLALLLAMAPLGLAQHDDEDGDDGDSSGSGDGTPEDCQADPDDSDCRGDGDDGNATHDDDANETEDDGRDGGRGRGRGHGGHEAARCDEDDLNRSEEARCRAAMRELRHGENRTWVTFDLAADNATLTNYTVAGLLALDAIALDVDNLSTERHGSTLRILGDGAELRLHDDPNGLVRFKGEAGNVTLDFPDGLAVERTEHGARVAYADGREGHLLAENVTWLDNDTAVLTDFFAFHVPPGHDEAGHEDEGEKEVDEEKRDAIERRTLGAEIKLRAPGPDALRSSDGRDSVEILAYDDLEVDVDLPADDATPEAPIRVVVSSELDEGRTIVLDLEEELLPSARAKDLLLSYYDLHPQADGTVLETEVVFKAAASLQDVLEPADDGGQPEYWIVADANGVQVLVSVPHWSAHAITVASLATALSAPSVAVGIVAGVAASALAGTLLLWPRRRDDDEL